MLARLYVALPFHIAVPEGAIFNNYTYEDEGYLVTLFPPGRTDRPAQGDVPDVVRMNHSPAFVANGLHIDFRKQSKEPFDRLRERVRTGAWDPPDAVIVRAVNSFLIRLRYVTRGFPIRLFSISGASWRLQYLHDDGVELEEDPTLIRGRRAINFNWTLVGLNQKVWEDMHSLDPDFEAPPWDSLRLDALAAFPNLGSAIVLATTSLEVFISQVLDGLSEEKQLPPALWRWLNERKVKRPNVEEQFDSLLRLLVGHSLTENQSLWKDFRNLKEARNSFVHRGIAKIDGTPVSSADAKRLVDRTGEIINWVKQWLPTNLTWPEFQPSIIFEFEHEFIRSSNASPQPTAGSTNDAPIVPTTEDTDHD
jgi:hypothetical protein